MALYNLDYPILPGAAARTLMIDADGTLPYVDTTGTEPLAKAETENAGELLCAIGTMVWNDDYTVICQLGPAGWAAVAGTLPVVDDPPEDPTPDEPEEPADDNSEEENNG